MKLKLTKSNISKMVERDATSIVIAQLIKKHKIVQAEFSKFHPDCDDHEKIDERFEPVDWLAKVIDKISNPNSKRDNGFIHDFSDKEKFNSMLRKLGFSVQESLIITLYFEVFHLANRGSDIYSKIEKIGRELNVISTCMFCESAMHTSTYENMTWQFRGCEQEVVDDTPLFSKCSHFEQKEVHDE